MNKKTIAIFAVCMVLVAALSVFTTLALLSDSKTVTNTFTSGNVTITLDEAPVGPDGQAIEGNRVTENNYKVYPGVEYDKDPTITLNEGSEAAYVGATITFTNAAALKEAGLDADEVLGYFGIECTGWKQIGTGAEVMKNTAGEGEEAVMVLDSYVYTFYKETELDLDGTTANTDKAVLFENFTLNVNASNDVVEATNNMKIIVNGYAVQAEGQADALTALQTGFDGLF